MIKRALLLLILSVLIIKTGSAFGLASGYLENNTMTISPGETREYAVEIQNADTSTMKVKFSLEDGIADIKDKKEFYFVGGDNPVETVVLQVRAPKNASIGSEYHIKYAAVPQSDGGSNINLNIRLNREFRVLVAEPGQVKEEGKSLLPLAIPVVVLALLIIAAAVFRKSNKTFGRLFKNEPKN